MIVLKFGGTSVEDATAIRRLISIVRPQLDRQPLVVVSAMGRTTNRLLECAQIAELGDLENAYSCLDAIIAEHFIAIDQLALPEEIADLRESLRRRFAAIRATLTEVNKSSRGSM